MNGLKKYFILCFIDISCFLLLCGCSSAKIPEFDITYSLNVNLMSKGDCSYVLCVKSGTMDFNEITDISIIPTKDIKDRITENKINMMNHNQDSLEVEGSITYNSSDLSDEQISNMTFFRNLLITLKSGEQITVSIPNIK